MKRIQKDDDYYGPPSQATQYQGIGSEPVVQLVQSLGKREPVYMVIDWATGRPIIVLPTRVTGKDTGLIETWMQGYGPNTVQKSYIDYCIKSQGNWSENEKRRAKESFAAYVEMHPGEYLVVPRDTPAYERIRNGGL